MRRNTIPVALCLLTACSSGGTPDSEASCTQPANSCESPWAPSQLVCSAAGVWEKVACPGSKLCNPANGRCIEVCTSGAKRCSDADPTAQQVCIDGNIWSPSSCEAGHVCAQESGECVPAACDAEQARCEGTTPSAKRSVCALDRRSYVDGDCASNEVCVTTGGGAECQKLVCKASGLGCSTDRTAVQSCNELGTSATVVVTCRNDEVCANGSCVKASSTLGEVLTLQPEQLTQPFALTAGRYALAAINLERGDATPVTLPVSITGAVLSHKLPVNAPPTLTLSPAQLRQSHCGTPLLPRPVPTNQSSIARFEQPIFPFANPPAIGDQRTFYYPDLGSSAIKLRTAVLRHVGATAYFWEDITDGPSGSVIDAATLADLTDRIDAGVIPRDNAMFGELTDVDGNGKVDVFFTNLLPDGDAWAFVTSATLFPPGSLSMTYDFGEVVYTTGGSSSALSAGDLAGLIAHELQHLIYYGRRLGPYLSTRAQVPDWVYADVYAVEGIARIAESWSGQMLASLAYEALTDPQEMSLFRLFGYKYSTSGNAACYGYGLLVMGYLFEQAGGVSISGKATVTDLGGVSFLDQFTTGQAGPSRLGAKDGRSFDQVYVDLGAALLASTLDIQELGPVSTADPKYRFNPVLQDAAFGGQIGIALRREDIGLGNGAVLKLTPWASRSTLRHGGMAFFDISIGDTGASLTVQSSQTALVLIRRKATL